MLELLSYPTGRPCWIVPHKVSTVMDLVETTPPKIQGGQPGLTIVGTLLVVEGAQVPIHGNAKDVKATIERAAAMPSPVWPVQ
jgi:hypothetical protein